ncbi:MAG: CPBP family intramembrane metalloprotease [Thaumarchaeota archaeon]|nr:CPBP family intramembrane metalloprotease [Nitrososphaerota archaeon]
MEAPETGQGRAVGQVLVAVFVILFAFTAVLVLASIPAGAYAIYSGKLSATFTSASLVRPFFWVGPIVFFAPLTLAAGAFFAILSFVYVAFLVYGARQAVRPWTAVSNSFKGGFGALTASPFVVMITSIAFLTFTASIIDALISSAGVPIGGISGDPLKLLLGFTASPLVEELGFRVALVGIVALILSVGRPWKEALGALWRPSKVTQGLAVGSGVSIIIWAATAFSAVTFGACHVVCGGGAWDIGKLPEAAYGGFVLGYLYVKYGLHVAVIAHWGVDYFGSAFAFFGQAAYGVPWNSGTSEFVGQYLVDVDVLLLFGLASFIAVVYIGVKRHASRKAEDATGALVKAPSYDGEAST